MPATAAERQWVPTWLVYKVATKAQSNKYTFTFTKIANMITFVRDEGDYVFREAEL